jgi:hypothetical protein
MTDNAQRHFDKEKLLLRWLLLFDYTNRKIISDLFKVSDGALSSFYRTMKKRNYISMEADPISIANNKIILLTKDGFERGATLNVDLDLNHLTHKRSIPPTMVRHQLMLQKYLANFGLEPSKIVSDKLIRKRVKDPLFIPDAIMLIDGKRAAVEMELTRKKPARIFYKYQQQINAMRPKNNGQKPLFSSVYFVFENQSLLETYKRHFQDKRWPYVVMENSKLYVKETAESELCFVPQEVDRINFNFVLTESKI